VLCVITENTREAPASVGRVAPTLPGRAVDIARVEGLLDQARAGRSAVLVVRGQAGIGKTALLEATAARAEGFRILRIRAVESESDLTYAGLHLLCSALLAEYARLKPAQRDALDAAIGGGDGSPDRLLIGLATLALLNDAAARQPLLCIIDDAQWLDNRSVQVLGFALRRIETDPIAVLLAERDPHALRGLEDLPSLRLDALSYADSRTLFRSLIRGRVDESVVGRIIAETRGNPQALLDVLDAVSSADFAGGYGVETDSSPGPPNGLLDRVERLPAAGRRLLLVAAADPTGDPALLWRAAAELAIAPEAAALLESCGLLQLSPRVTFDHPADRSAIYGMASKADRRATHRALAEATDPDVAPDRLVWHRALAAHGPDVQLACELERYAPAAGERGGPGAAAAFLEQAAVPTAP
jgi:hypothetical protein